MQAAIPFNEKTSKNRQRFFEENFMKGKSDGKAMHPVLCCCPAGWVILRCINCNKKIELVVPGDSAKERKHNKKRAPGSRAAASSMQI